MGDDPVAVDDLLLFARITNLGTDGPIEMGFGPLAWVGEELSDDPDLSDRLSFFREIFYMELQSGQLAWMGKGLR